MGVEELRPGLIDPDVDLHFPSNLEQRGKLVAYYLEQLGEELPYAMLNAGGETFEWLYKSAKKIGEIAEEGWKIAQGN